MRFRDRDYEMRLAKVGRWLQLADYWNERDPKFAELLRTKAREIQRAEDERAKTLCDALPASVRLSGHCARRHARSPSRQCAEAKSRTERPL